MESLFWDINIVVSELIYQGELYKITDNASLTFMDGKKKGK